MFVLFVMKGSVDEMYDNSVNTSHVLLSTLNEEFYKWKLVQMIPAIMTCVGFCSVNPITTALFGKSGCGKTVAQKIALAMMKNNGFVVYEINKGGFTLAGLSKLFKSNVDEATLAKRKMLQAAELLFLEDLSDITDYMAESVVSLITSLSEDTVMDYTTNEVQNRFDVGVKKRSVFGGTDGHYFRLLKSSSWNDKVRRRVVCMFMYYFNDELTTKESYTDSLKTSKATTSMAMELYDKRDFSNIRFTKRKEVTNTVSLELRNKAWRTMYKVIPESNSCKYLTDSIAEGHAVFNNRGDVIDEDYQFILDFLPRYLLPFTPVDFKIFSYLIEKGSKATIRELLAVTDVGRKKLDSEIDVSPLIVRQFDDVEYGNLRHVVVLSDLVNESKKRFDLIVSDLKEVAKR